MRKKGVSKLDSADLARRRVIKNWTRIFVVLTAVLLGCSIALIPLHWEVEDRLESALTRDIELLQNVKLLRVSSCCVYLIGTLNQLREPITERLTSQFSVATTLQSERLGDPLPVEEREAMQTRRLASRADARSIYVAQEDQLRERGANASTLELYYSVLVPHYFTMLRALKNELLCSQSLQERMYEREMLALNDSTVFYEGSEQYLVDILTLMKAEVNLSAFMEEVYYGHLDEASDLSDSRVPLLAVTWTLLGVILVLMFVAARHITRHNLRMIEIAKRSHEKVRSMVQVDLITIDREADQEESKSSTAGSSTATLSVSFSHGFGKVEMRKTKRVLFLAVLFALSLAIAALATSTHLYEHHHEPGIHDAREVGWPMLAQLRAITFFFADRVIALAMGSLANSFIEHGASKAGVDEISHHFFSRSENFTAVLATAHPAIRAMELFEASNIIEDLIIPATPEDSKVINQTYVTPSLPAVDAYQEAVMLAAHDAMNFTEGVPLYSNESERQLIDATTAPFYLSAVEIIGNELRKLSDIATEEAQRRRRDDRNEAETASGLTVACLVVFVLSLGAIAYSSRRLHQQARVRFNGAAWKLGRVLSDKECATLFRTFVIKQMCRETLDFCECLRATHFQVTGLSLLQAALFHEVFISTESETAINVSAQTRRAVPNALKREFGEETWSEAVEQVHQVLQQTPFKSPAADTSAASVMPELEKDDRMLDDPAVAVFRSLLREAEELVATNSLYPFVASPEFLEFDERRCQAIQRDIELLAEITHA
ncbi:MAG: hypothetical protein MHM6MM_001799 [Cercozoa sp. M6MM]